MNVQHRQKKQRMGYLPVKANGHQESGVSKNSKKK